MEWGAGLLPHVSGEAKRQGMAWVPVSPSMTRAIGLTSLYTPYPGKTPQPPSCSAFTPWEYLRVFLNSLYTDAVQGQVLVGDL